MRHWLTVPGLEPLGVVLKGYDERLDQDDDDTVRFTNARAPRGTVRYTVVK